VKWSIAGRYNAASDTVEPFELAHELAWPFSIEADARLATMEAKIITYSERVKEFLRHNLTRAQECNATTTTPEDISWVEEPIAEAQDALDEPFEPCLLMEDYKEENLVVTQHEKRWRVSGVFDLMGAHFGDSEADLSPLLAFLTLGVVQFPCTHQHRRKSRSLNNDIAHRSWQVLLLGGPSGVGKTSVSYRLAHHFGIGITEVDDFQVILERMTTPTEQPVLHYWRTHPEAVNQPAEEIVKRTIAVGQVMALALEAVIANHIESRAPLVLEGDFILPMRASSFSEGLLQSQVRTLFLYEESEEQFRHNFLLREPEHGLQEKRAQVSWLYGQWLKQEAERVGALTVPARPWNDLFERILTALK
jgi:hypothetical protein